MSKVDDPVRVMDHVWIPLSDGTRLAARIWLPSSATPSKPVPAVLEYLPYRKNDLTAGRDARMHPFFAERGYASVRVDARGTGDSDGFLEGEYLPQEQADTVEAIAWLAEQPWCTGKVGMIGISWGGFAGLQVAAERPPQLAGVISVASTDDRYLDDVHYMGGAVNAWDQVTWAATVTALAAMPPSKNVREDWRDVWLSRLEHASPMVHDWMAHQTRDSFWKHGSVAEDYDRMACPIFMVGGWNDAYRDSVFRVLVGYSGFSKGLIGPWAHTYPEQGTPGPAIDFLGEAVRWWDFCLKGIDNGVQDEPKLQAWMQDTLDPDAGYSERSGEWVAFDSWPVDAAPHARFFLAADAKLSAHAGATTTVTHSSQLVPVSNRGNWCPGGWSIEDYDLPGDQQAEDARSLTFTSDPLAAEIPLLGVPELQVSVSADKPDALIAVRLLDVNPAGGSTLVARGFVNLTHRNGHENPKPVVPGDEYDVTIPMRSNGYRFAAGHRVRVAIDTAYWPWVWPSPSSAAVSITAGGSSFLRLPALPATSLRPRSRPPANGSLLRTERIGEHVPATRSVIHEPISDEVAIIDTIASATERLVDSGRVHGESGTTRFIVVEGDPLSARIECHREFSFSEDGHPEPIGVLVHSSMSSTATDFILDTRIEAFEGDRQIFDRRWTQTIARHHV